MDETARESPNRRGRFRLRTRVMQENSDNDNRTIVLFSPRVLVRRLDTCVALRRARIYIYVCMYVCMYRYKHLFSDTSDMLALDVFIRNRITDANSGAENAFDPGLCDRRRTQPGSIKAEKSSRSRTLAKWTVSGETKL